jgi:hypothetical protein
MWSDEDWKKAAREHVANHPIRIDPRWEPGYARWIARYFDLHEEDCCCWSCILRLHAAMLKAAALRRACSLDTEGHPCR